MVIKVGSEPSLFKFKFEFDSNKFNSNEFEYEILIFLNLNSSFKNIYFNFHLSRVSFSYKIT